MRRLALILALTFALTLVIAGMALAAPGTYTNPSDYKDNLTPSSSLGNNLTYGEGAKKSVVFMVTPVEPGEEVADRSYTGTNANQSGLYADVNDGSTVNQVVRKANGETIIHGSFKTNANACAACHMTHVAAGDALLIRNGIFNTCTACHDGTLGKLNIFDIPAYDNDQVNNPAGFVAVGGGTFGGAVDTDNASMHLPTGYLEVAAAPGGNRNPDHNDPNHFKDGAWKADFTCASCHQPHGSYSDRLLAPNPANIQRTKRVLNANHEYVGDEPIVYDFVPLASNPNYWVAGVDANQNGQLDTVEQRVYGPWVYGSTYGYGATQTVIFYASDQSFLNVNGVDDPASPGGKSFAMIPQSKQLNGRFYINYAKGIATKKSNFNPTGPIKIAIVPALIAKVEKGVFVDDNGNPIYYDRAGVTAGWSTTYPHGQDGTIYKWTGAYKITGKSGNNLTYAPTANNGTDQQGITWFCAACHTDYYADAYVKINYADEVQLEGKYTTAWRHTINRTAISSEDGRQNLVYANEIPAHRTTVADALTCLSCHYAHGTAAQIMRNADDTPLAPGEKDVNPSSALKRYVNMAVCYKCHASSHNDELANTDSFYAAGGAVSSIMAANGNTPFPQEP